MTWTEGALQICDAIIIYGGYWGVISFGILVLLSVIIVIFLSLALGTLLSSTLKELKN
jgi:hypothetical protein